MSCLSLKLKISHHGWMPLWTNQILNWMTKRKTTHGNVFAPRVQLQERDMRSQRLEHLIYDNQNQILGLFYRAMMMNYDAGLLCNDSTPCAEVWPLGADGQGFNPTLSHISNVDSNSIYLNYAPSSLRKGQAFMVWERNKGINQQPFNMICRSRGTKTLTVLKA